MFLDKLFTKTTREAPSAPVRETFMPRRCSPPVVPADSFKTRREQPLILNAG